jgi:hypothetical protein
MLYFCLWSTFCRFALITLKRFFFTRDKKKEERFLNDTSEEEEEEEEKRGAKEQLIRRKVCDLSRISFASRRRCSRASTRARISLFFPRRACVFLF